MRSYTVTITPDDGIGAETVVKLQVDGATPRITKLELTAATGQTLATSQLPAINLEMLLASVQPAAAPASDEVTVGGSAAVAELATSTGTAPEATRGATGPGRRSGGRGAASAGSAGAKKTGGRKAAASESGADGSTASGAANGATDDATASGSSANGASANGVASEATATNVATRTAARAAKKSAATKAAAGTAATKAEARAAKKAGGRKAAGAKTATEKPAAKKPASKSAGAKSASGGRAYRTLPADFAAVYQQAASVGAVADYYGVPRHTAQNWVATARRRDLIPASRRRKEPAARAVGAKKATPRTAATLSAGLFSG